MTTQDTVNIRNSSISYLALRRCLGILGLLLPLLVVVFNGFEFKSSISHFYYSSSSVFFTGFMFAFGIFLIFYPGRVDESDKISDGWVTTIGGIGAILTALIPTAYCSLSELPILITTELSSFCDGAGLTTQYIHNNSTLSFIHLSCAAIFLGLMGYMSFSRFTKGRTTAKMRVFYKFCAIMVWLPLVILGLKFIFNLEWTPYDVFILECVSLVFFGIAWLVKGKMFERYGFH